jgi:hypothetical protein
VQELYEIARRVAASLEVEEEKVRKILEEKVKNPQLGYRRLGSLVGLKKDKVQKILKMCVKVAEEKLSEEKIGKFYAYVFSLIDKYREKGLKPVEIARELVKKLKIVPAKAQTVVLEYYGFSALEDVEEAWDEIEELRKNVENWMKETRGEIAKIKEQLRRAGIWKWQL